MKVERKKRNRKNYMNNSFTITFLSQKVVERKKNEVKMKQKEKNDLKEEKRT